MVDTSEWDANCVKATIRTLTDWSFERNIVIIKKYIIYVPFSVAVHCRLSPLLNYVVSSNDWFLYTDYTMYRVCLWFGSSLVSGESVNSVTDGLVVKSRTPSGNQSGSFTSHTAFCIVSRLHCSEHFLDISSWILSVLDFSKISDASDVYPCLGMIKED